MVSNTTNLFIDEDGLNPIKVTVTKHNSNDTTVHLQFINDYYSSASIDGNGNMIFEWKHGQGQGRIKIPHGGCYDLFRALQILDKIGGFMPTATIYKELT